MGTRIAFRPRARGCAVAGLGSPAGASALEPRIKYVKGVTSGTPASDEVLCGEGTDFPIILTMYELQEFIHRVKIAWVTAGSFDHEDDGAGYSTYFSHNAPSVAPTTTELTENVSTGISFLLAKKLGYTTEDTTSGITLDRLDATFKTEYTVTGLDGDSDYYARDIGNDERGMWSFPEIAGNHPKINEPSEFRCGFSYYMGNYYGFGNGGQTTDTSIPSSSYGYTEVNDPLGTTYLDLDIECIVTGRVAYVNTAGGNGPFASDAVLYPELSFKVYGVLDYLAVHDIVLSTKIEDAGFSDSGIQFTLRLAGPNDVSCKLYSPIPTLSNTVSYSGSNWVLEAQEWWPYAHRNGNPVWNTATGAWVAP
jgi:hypothetical protein